MNQHITLTNEQYEALNDHLLDDCVLLGNQSAAYKAKGAIGQAAAQELTERAHSVFDVYVALRRGCDSQA